MRIAIVSDAWQPQVNGVVRTLEAVARELAAMEHAVEVFGPDRFASIPCPSYAEIRLALFPDRRLRRLLDDFAPEAIHIATEGPLGLAAHRYCRRRRYAFTTSFHTRFPDYVKARIGLPTGPLYAWLRSFHNAGAGILVATASLEHELAGRGFHHLRRWSRGVDLELFRPPPDSGQRITNLPRPVFAYVGRVAVEKNIAAFLALDLPGSRVVVGDGPQRVALERAFPAAHFLGTRHGPALAAAYGEADVMVFPSRTDTFGNVILESLACGTPVAAYPVTGPLDVIDGHGVGALSEDLGAAALAALAIPRDRCRSYAERFSWHACAEQFLQHLAPVR